MATPSADTNLSLGKLGRAAFGTAAYTTEISMSDCAGNTTADQDHSISSFYISAVTSSLTGYPYVDESTNETYELEFVNANTLFGTRIKTRAANFTWTTSNSSLFNMSGTQDYTTQYNAGAIADASTPGSMESTLVTDGEFENWNDLEVTLDSWTKSGTISKNTSGNSGNAVQFESDGAYVEQTFTVKGNSTYQISASIYSSNPGTSNINAQVSGAYTTVNTGNFIAMAGSAGGWTGWRDDFYTSGSANVNQSLTIRFTAPDAGSVGIDPSLDSVSFQRWEGANFGDTDVTITGKYHDAGQSDGFNDHATRYNTAISKVVEIQDTYAGQSIACFLPGTKIQMADGSEKDIEDVNVGDEVLSVVLPGLPDEDLGYLEWKAFESTAKMTNLEVSSATVEHIFYDYMGGYHSINDGLIKVTVEHDFWTYTGDLQYHGTEEKWEWCTPTQLKVGEKLLDHEGNLIEITSLEYIGGEVEVINFDVEPLDIYFAGGVLVHNKGASSEP